MVFISKCGSSHLIFHFLPEVLSSRNSPRFVVEASVQREIYDTVKDKHPVPWMG